MNVEVTSNPASPRGPFQQVRKPKVRIENWRLEPAYPEGVFVLYGSHVIGHPWLRDDQGPIRTSRLLSIDFTQGTAETLNTIYVLGTPATRAS